MSIRNLASMDIAIVGNTNTAATYAVSFANAGHSIYMACSDKNTTDYVEKSCKYSNNIFYSTIEEAAEVADLIIIATIPKDVRKVSYLLGDVRKKVIIDATANEFVITENENKKTTSAIQTITGSKHVIKIFNMNGYQEIIKPIFLGKKIDLLLLSDSKKAIEITKIMAKEIGMSEFFFFGRTESLALFNEMTSSWRNLFRSTTKTSEKSYIQDI